MWNKSENDNQVKPEALDAKTSREYIYIRKDFELIQATADRPAHWEYMEARIRRDDWELFTELMEHAQELSVLSENSDMIIECILEMSEIIYGDEE